MNNNRLLLTVTLISGLCAGVLAQPSYDTEAAWAGFTAGLFVLPSGFHSCVSPQPPRVCKPKSGVYRTAFRQHERHDLSEKAFGERDIAGLSVRPRKHWILSS